MRIRELATLMLQPAKVNKTYHVIYCRRSSESEDKQCQSIQDQKNILLEEAAKRQIKILKIFEESRSAKAPGRPIFNEMAALLKERKDIKGILCWKLNRISRNPQDSGLIQQYLLDGTIEEIITPSKTYTEVDSDFVMAVENAQSSRFIRDLRQDTVRGISSKVAKGNFPGPALPGYINNTGKRQGEKDISPHPVFFTLMRKVFDMGLSGSFSVKQLCEESEVLGIRNNKGNPIPKTTMHRILSSSFYTGRFIYQGKVHQGAHPAMITDEEYDLMQQILNNKSKPHSHNITAPLNGLIRCGTCGASITGESHLKKYANGKSQVFTYYRCTNYGKNKCRESYVPAGKLEKQVTDYLNQYQIPHQYIEWAMRWVKEANKEEVGLRQAEYEASKAAYEASVSKVDKLTDLSVSKLITDEEFVSKREQLVKERDILCSRFHKFDVWQDEWTDLAVKSINFLTAAEEKFLKGTIDDKKLVLKALSLNLKISDRKLVIAPRVHLEPITKGILLTREILKVEPNESGNISTQSGNFDTLNPIWGG